MKYIKLFKNDAEYQAFKGGWDYITPNLCLNSETWETKCEPEEEEVNLITFYINNIECQAENGMTFEEWIFSDYFDTSNPYNIVAENPNMDVRSFLEKYGDDYPTLRFGVGIPFIPQINKNDYIINEMNYKPSTAGGF